MKLAFCSEYSDKDIIWTRLSQVPLLKAIPVHSRPSKAVLGIILLLEQGKFPIIKTSAVNDVPLKESMVVHEAYIRCHMSVVPTIPEEPIGEEPDANNYNSPFEPDEQYGDGPIPPAERE